MAAYLLALIKVTDKDKFLEYAALAKEFPAKYGGKYLASGKPIEVIEGEAVQAAVVISKWPDADAIKSMWFSDDYEEIKKIRAGAADVSAMIFDSLDDE